MRLKNLVANVLLLAATLVALGLVAEGVMRLVTPDSVQVRLMHRPDDERGYRLVENYEFTHRTSEFSVPVRINAEGLRDREYPRERDPRVFRILALGDSFTFGVGVRSEDTYPKVLEGLLNGSSAARGRTTYEVVNAGVEGYGPEQEYASLKGLLGRYQPDLVIVGLYSNDVADTMAGIRRPRGFGQHRVYVLEYLKGVKFHLRSLLNRFKDPTMLLEIYQDRYSPEFERALRRTRELLAKIRDASRSAGAETLVVLIPMCLEVERSQWEKKGFGRLYSDEFFNRNMARFSETFVEFGKTEGIPVVPLLPVFRSSTVRPLYFAKDAHWTAEGNRVAAEAIFDHLRQTGLAAAGEQPGSAVPVRDALPDR